MGGERLRLRGRLGFLSSTTNSELGREYPCRAEEKLEKNERGEVTERGQKSAGWETAKAVSGTE